MPKVICSVEFVEMLKLLFHVSSSSNSNSLICIDSANENKHLSHLFMLYIIQKLPFALSMAHVWEWDVWEQANVDSNELKMNFDFCSMFSHSHTELFEATLIDVLQKHENWIYDVEFPIFINIIHESSQKWSIIPLRVEREL